MTKRSIPLFCLLAFAVLGLSVTVVAQTRLRLPLDTIALPPGFSIDLYTTTAVPNARTLVLSEDTSNGTIVYVSTQGLSNVYAVIDHNKDGIADSVVTVVSNLTAPLGLAYANGSLWVATTPTIYRFDNVDVLARAGKNFTTPHVVLAGLGTPSDHGNHYMTFGPDNMLYFNLGAPFNIGIPPAVGEHGLSYATIAKMSPNGTNVSTYATGTRNIVGMQFHPTNKTLYFSCNGRDQIGDNTPDDYIAYAPTSGLNFGYPYCHRQGSGDPNLRAPGPGIPYPDPEFPPPAVANASFAAQQGFCEVYQTPPVQVVGPHVATLGMKFYTGDMFPSDYNMSIINAQHGSWDRNVPLGYRVMVLNLGEDGLAKNYSALAEGWLLPNNTVWGRPADVLPMPDGSVLVSDDLNGALYRITYSQALANIATVNATADNANFTDRVLPELQLAPAPDVSEMVPSMVAAAQTAG